MDDSRENAIEENVDLFVNRYRPLANNFGFVKGFLSAAVGHAASTADRTVVRELLLDAAAALDRHDEWRGIADRSHGCRLMASRARRRSAQKRWPAPFRPCMRLVPTGSGQSSIPRHCARHLSCWDGMITRPPLQFSGRRRTSFAQSSLTKVREPPQPEQNEQDNAGDAERRPQPRTAYPRDHDRGISQTELGRKIGVTFRAAYLVSELETPLDRAVQLVRGISLIAQRLDEQGSDEPAVPISTIADIVDEILQDLSDRHLAILALLRPPAA